MSVVARLRGNVNIFEVIKTLVHYKITDRTREEIKSSKNPSKRGQPLFR